MIYFTIHSNLKYKLGGDIYGVINLFSLNPSSYPHIYGLDKTEITNVYESHVWVKIRGCDALFMGFKEDKVLLDVRPSNDVDILEAKQVDRGIYHTSLPKHEIEQMWEERKPYKDFPFPEGMERIKYLSVDDFRYPLD